MSSLQVASGSFRFGSKVVPGGSGFVPAADANTLTIGGDLSGRALARPIQGETRTIWYLGVVFLHTRT